MPVLNGLEATRDLIGMMDDFEIKRAPIVGVTAYDASVRREFLESGAKDLTMKPMMMETMKAFLERYTLPQDQVSPCLREL